MSARGHVLWAIGPASFFACLIAGSIALGPAVSASSVLTEQDQVDIIAFLKPLE